MSPIALSIGDVAKGKDVKLLKRARVGSIDREEDRPSDDKVGQVENSKKLEVANKAVGIETSDANDLSIGDS